MPRSQYLCRWAVDGVPLAPEVRGGITLASRTVADTIADVAWSYVIDTVRDVLLVKATGVFTDTDLQDMRTVTTRDPRFHREIRALFDYVEVSQSGVTLDAVGSWPMGQLYGPKSRRAIVVRPGLHEAIAHAFRYSIDQDAHGKVLVADTRGDAVAWLNQDVAAEKRIE